MSEDPTLFETNDPELRLAAAKKTKSPLWKSVNILTVVETFELWVAVHNKRSPVLTPERHKVIGNAIATYGAEMVNDAIQGCALSDWHMGKNPGGKKYNDISLILRNAEKVEGFAELYSNQNSGGGFLD